MTRRNEERRIARSIATNDKLVWISRWFTEDELVADVAALKEDGVISDQGSAVRYYERFQRFSLIALHRSPFGMVLETMMGRPS